MEGGKITLYDTLPVKCCLTQILRDNVSINNKVNGFIYAYCREGLSFDLPEFSLKG